MKGRKPTPCTIPRTEISRRSLVGVLMAQLTPSPDGCLAEVRGSPRALSAPVYSGSFAERVLLHPLDLQIPLDARPLRGHRGPGSDEQAEEQQFLHDLTSLCIFSTTDSTSF